MSIAIFTDEDLDCQRGEVFDAARRFGKVEVRISSGEVFTIAPKAVKTKPTAERLTAKFEALWGKQRELGYVPPPASDNERINRIIAGEE
jgi:hypothetical protein